MQLPVSGGLYVLVLRVVARRAIPVGRLGSIDFPAGWYAYVGSARGPGGLAARVGRHLRPDKALHWHIDYLSACADPVAVWHHCHTEARECQWMDALLALPGACTPARGFGSSDCRCRAHLSHHSAPPCAGAFACLVDLDVTVDVLTGVLPQVVGAGAAN